MASNKNSASSDLLDPEFEEALRKLIPSIDENKCVNVKASPLPKKQRMASTSSDLLDSEEEEALRILIPHYDEAPTLVKQKMGTSRKSISSITKFDEDDFLEHYDELVEINDGFLHSNTKCNTNDKATSCRSSSPTLSLEKVPDSSEDEHFINNEPGENQNICRQIEEQRDANTSFSQGLCVRTCSPTFLKYSGVFLFFNGLFLAFGKWSFCQIAPVSQDYVEGPVQIYISCSIMIVCGILAFITKILHKRNISRKHYLILFVFFLSLVCTSFCAASLVYLITVIHSSLNQLHECVFNDVDRICSCYGPDRKLFRFAENMGCSAVKYKLKELAYGVSVLFGVGCLISMATALSAGFLLFKAKRDNRHRLRTRKAQINTRSTTVANTNASPEVESTFSVQQQRHREHKVQVRTHQDQAPQRWKMAVKNKRKAANKRASNGATRTTISSVATQTPSFMMSVTSLDRYGVSDNEIDTMMTRDVDTCSELSLDLMNHASLNPPSYSEAIKILKQETK